MLVREEPERPPVAHPERAEVTPVQRDDEVRPQPFGEYCDRGVGGTQWEIGISLDEVGDKGPFPCVRRFDLPIRQASKKSDLGARAYARAEKVRNLTHDERWYYQVQTRLAKEGHAACMVAIVTVGRSKQWPRVNDRDQRRSLLAGFLRGRLIGTRVRFFPTR